IVTSFFFFHVAPTTAIYPLSLHDALPISGLHAFHRRGLLRDITLEQNFQAADIQRRGQAIKSEVAARAEAFGLGPQDITVHAHRSEEHTSELQSRENLVCRLLLEKKKQPT